MKSILLAAAALLALAGPAQAYNFYLVNDVQMTGIEVLSWASAGNADKACAALVKIERLAAGLGDSDSMEAAAKAQALTTRSHLQRLRIYCLD